MKIDVSKTVIDRATALFVVALERGRVVGSCSLMGWGDPHPILTSLFVKPAHRRKGVATAMIQECIRRARRARKPAVALTVNNANKGAKALYRRLGFCSFTADKTVTWMGLALDQ